jgi:hypothetical protein
MEARGDFFNALDGELGAVERFQEATGEARRLAGELWKQLQDVNRCLGCGFYEGLVARRSDSLYPIQLNSPDQTTPAWMKHRFIE